MRTTSYFRLIELFYKEFHLGELHFPSTGIQKQPHPGATLNILNPNSFHKIHLFCDSIEDKKLHTRYDVFMSN